MNIELDGLHKIHENDRRTYKFTLAQEVFLQHYLSNGMKAGLAAQEAIKATSPKVYEEQLIKDEKKKTYFNMRGARFKESIAVSGYLSKVMTGKAGVTVDHIKGVLTTFLDDEGEETKNRIKAAELLLKHLDGFKQHNESKAPKSLTILNSMTKDEIDAEMKKISGSIQTPIEYTEYTDLDE